MEKKIADWLKDHMGCVFKHGGGYIVIVKQSFSGAEGYGNIIFDADCCWSVGFLRNEELYEEIVSRPVVARLPNFNEVLDELASVRTSAESDAELHP